MAALGYTNLTLDNLIRIRDHGVTPDYAKALRRYATLAVEDLVMLRDHGLTAERIGPRTNAPAPGCRSICSSRCALTSNGRNALSWWTSSRQRICGTASARSL